MKLLFLAISVLFSTIVADDDEWIAGKNLRVSRAVVTEVQTNTSKCATAVNGATFCTSSPGCTNAGYFQCYNGAALASKACTGVTPYCSSGSCVAVQPDGCPATNFVCPGAGYFPKYDDCLTYYYCYFDPTVNDFVAITKVCNTGYPFNPTGPQDRMCLKGAACVTATCTAGKAAEWKALNYAGFTTNQIVLYCVSAKPVRIDSCPAGLSFDLTNTVTKTCTVKCVKDYQLASYPPDNTMFQECRGGKAYLEQCEYGKIFDGYSLSCVLAPTTTAAPTTTTTTTTKPTTTTTTTTTTKPTTTTTTTTKPTTTTTTATKPITTEPITTPTTTTERIDACSLIESFASCQDSFEFLN